MLKAELHAHTSEDPRDKISYDAATLVDRVAALGYQVLAITLHDKWLDVASLESYARERGVVLLPGIERTVRRKHVLLVNFPKAAEQVRSFEDLARLKARSNGVVIAPHPFFPASNCLHGQLDAHRSLFDAVEVNAFYTRTLDFNRRAVRWAAAHGKPLVGNGDVHRIEQLDHTYSLIDAPPDRDAICEAIRAGRVEIRTRPVSHLFALRHVAFMFGSDGSKRSAVETAPAVVESIG
jgi:predicted metal-dependent phosphoesterase TrpH